MKPIMAISSLLGVHIKGASQPAEAEKEVASFWRSSRDCNKKVKYPGFAGGIRLRCVLKLLSQVEDAASDEDEGHE